MSSSNDNTDNGEWGWEALGSEDDNQDNSDPILTGNSMSKDESEVPSQQSAKSPVKRNFSSKKNSFSNAQQLKGISSSPSFLELEKAIGATLALSLSSNDSGDLSEKASSPGYLSRSKMSSTNLTQQKVLHQRMRQQNQQERRQSPHNNQNQRFFPPAYQVANALTVSPSAKEELVPYIVEEDSRALILFHSPQVSPIDIRNMCSKYGVLYYLRSEFHARGVTFLSYFDLRAAVAAKLSLPQELGEGADASAHNSVMLHAANSSSEESRLVLSNLSAGDWEEAVTALFSRFGELRCVDRIGPNISAAESVGDDDGAQSAAEERATTCHYIVEFFSIQDARLAASESQADLAGSPWGASTALQSAPLDEGKQRLCRQLLSTLAKWRSEVSSNVVQYQQHMPPNSPLSSPLHMMMASPMGAQQYPFPHMMMAGAQQPHPPYVPSDYSSLSSFGFEQQLQQMHLAQQPMSQPLYAVSPHGSSDNLAAMSYNHMYAATAAAAYNMSLMAAAGGGQFTAGETMPQPQQQHYYHEPQQAQQPQISMYQQMGGVSYPPLPTYGPAAETHYQQQQRQPNRAPHAYSNQGDSRRQGRENNFKRQQPQQQSHSHQQYQQQYHGGAVPHHHNGGHSAPQHMYPPSHPVSAYQQQHSHSDGVMGGSRAPGQQSRPENYQQVDADFALDPARLGEDSDSRTTIMVRNIPNKYNQAMLLEEVNQRHEGTYDFFYLPIDFKNRCNVGYCFINFIDTRFIAPFVREFNGQRWKSFNSEKICAVSFARIQGRQAMIARFQNSSLLEKSDEYQPLLFHSSGPDVGKPEPFPTGTRHRANSGSGFQQQQQQQYHSTVDGAMDGYGVLQRDV